MTLNDCEDPYDFGLKIVLLKLEFNNLLIKEEDIATLIGVACARYATTICGKQKRIENRREEITCRALVEAMCDVRRLGTKNSKAGMNDVKIALVAVQPGAFAGNCHNCGKRGHSSFECPSNRIPSSGGKKRKECDIIGHASRDCWEDPKNKGKSSRNWVSRKKKKERGGERIPRGNLPTS